MAVRYEMVGTKVMPVAKLGYADSMVLICGEDNSTFNGIVISNMPALYPTRVDQLDNPMVVTFRTKHDIDLMIRNLQTLRQKFNTSI